ncbi:unnamed protein product [Closterium sp. Naga37s-1]|nr:unnamed protein product [Closterium sp. Naga37s-1]
MASAPPARAESWTPPLPAKPAFPPSAPPPSAPPPSAPPPSTQPLRVRSAFSAAFGARKQWDAASADGLRAATAVVNRLVQLKQLPGKDLGALGVMEGMVGMVGRAAEKIRRLMVLMLPGLAAAVDALVPALLPLCPTPHIPPPLHAPAAMALPTAAPESTVAPFTFAAPLAAPVPVSTVSTPAAAPSRSQSGCQVALAASVSPSPSAAVWDANEAWQEAWQERDMYPEEPIFTALHHSVFERWAVDVANMFHKELMVKDDREAPAAREEEAESDAAGCLQGEGMGTSSGDTEAVVGGESDEGRVQGGAALLQGQNGWKGQAWAQGFGAAEGGEWVVVKQQLEQSGLLGRPPTPQQLQVCLVAWLVEMHIDSRHLSFIFAAVDEEVKSAAA